MLWTLPVTAPEDRKPSSIYILNTTDEFAFNTSIMFLYWHPDLETHPIRNVKPWPDASKSFNAHLLNKNIPVNTQAVQNANNRINYCSRTTGLPKLKSTLAPVAKDPKTILQLTISSSVGTAYGEVGQTALQKCGFKFDHKYLENVFFVFFFLDTPFWSKNKYIESQQNAFLYLTHE